MVLCSTYSSIITLTNKFSDHNMLYDTFLAKTWRSNDSKSASSYALKPASVIILMNKVKVLKDSLGVSERCQDYHQVENLMARTENIESSPTPSLRYLVGVSQFQLFSIRAHNNINEP
jgi:hypothetical protein